MAALLEDKQRSTNMAPPYIYNKFSKVFFANNFFKKCFSAPKIIPELMF